jgi:hypothetical protein
MQTYALVSGVIALVALCFIDSGIQPAIAKGGRWTLLVSSIIFVITESIVLLA